jgi:type IV pilus assembly protein PilQ
MSKWRACGLAFALTFGAAWQVQAEPVIQSINSTQQAGGEVLRVELSEPLTAVPQGFSVQTPPRIALDLPGVSNGIGKSSVEINQGNVRSVSVAQAGERTRLVLNLRQPANYRAELQGKTLLVVMDGSGPSVAAEAPKPADGAVHFAQSLNSAPLPIKDIDFRRGQDGAGRVVVNLASNQVGVDIRQQGKSLVVEFLRSSLPDSLHRKLDVTDFGTPVQSVSTFQSGDKVRMVVEPRGAWEHSAYQSDNQFVLEVRPQKVDPTKLTQGPGFSGEKLSLNFQNIDVRSLLQVIADFTNFNVVTSDTVTGSVTLRLKDVPWDQALDIILQAKGLGLKKNGNVILIAPKDELAAKEKVELESKKQIAELEPVRTQSFALNYTKAEDVSQMLTGSLSGQGGGGTGNRSVLSARGSVSYEKRTNQLFVTDTPSKLEEISGIITSIDVATRQVLIEARIVEANDTFGRSLGAKLGINDARGLRGGTPGYGIGDNNRVLFGGNLNAVGAQTLQPTATQSFADTQFVNLPAQGQNNFDAATFALSLFGASSNRFLNLELSALEADGKGKIVSSPRVITADQVEALIEQGEELPYQVATSSGATALQFRKANLALKVTPQITPEGNMILTLDINKDSVGRNTAAGLAIDTKHVKTQVLVENGGTIVIGGIFTQNEREDVTKVPYLGDVPILGNLFKTRTKSNNKTELLIFITPKVVNDRSGLR